MILPRDTDADSSEDRVPYVCQNPHCQEITYAPPDATAILCGHCGGYDAPPKRRALHPLDVAAMVTGVLALAWVVLS